MSVFTKNANYGHLYQIDLPYACGGIMTNENDVVFEAAPIYNWMIGKPIEEIKLWVSSKKGKITKAKA